VLGCFLSTRHGELERGKSTAKGLKQDEEKRELMVCLACKNLYPAQPASGIKEHKPPFKMKKVWLKGGRT